MAWVLVGTTKLGSFHQLEVWLEQRSQNIANNNTVIAYEFGIRRTATNGGAYWTTNTNNSAWLTVNGTNISIANFSYDFRNSTYKVLASSTITVPHNADGTKSVYINGTIQIGSGLLQGGNANGTLWLTTIPRASSISSVTGSTIGSVVTVAISRASSSFTHTVKFTFGNYSHILTGQSTSASFTPPLDWCNAIPNATSGTGTITLTTYNGSTQIGSTVSRSFTLTVPNSVWPSFSHISNSEYVADIRNKVGAYVQGQSRVTLAINGAKGSYGSTIKSYKITLAGHTINSVSGTTGKITQNGNLTITGSVTDSRGRTAQASTTISVLAYAAPKISSVRFERCTSTGTIDALGTFVKVTFSGSVSSLINGTQKNKLNYKIFSKRTSESSYVTKTNTDHGSLSYSASTVLSTYAIDYSFNFVARITDIFGETSSFGVVAIGEVLMHWHKSSLSAGMLLPGTVYNFYVGPKGMNSYGPIYQNNGVPVANGYCGRIPSGINLNDKNDLGSLGTGVYWSVQNDGVTGKPSDYGFLVILASFGSSEGYATWKHQATGDHYWTSWNANNVTGWRRFIDSNNYYNELTKYHSDRIIGYSSNANGQYWKYESGRLICRVIGVCPGVDTTWGGMAYGYLSTKDWTFPHAFANRNITLTGSPQYYAGWIGSDAILANKVNGLALYRGNIYNVSTPVTIEASGYWK
ncbi:hypothetical protein G7059_07880 [Erysipelothrix sp. HDW6A]|uniref:DUF859 family phage minor structural protein n=1 Tax=Erysipelothrix sp. HDW6A TaxID=2714928 RepID=UPI00140B6A2C|nr:DUF859 family phage minor structural protein [Erysipelothrix sp. HDW6A]QIK57762.1 hypothetical protein G7059_07880 [Erysipelothrix sp. HDW6A]